MEINDAVRTGMISSYGKVNQFAFKNYTFMSRDVLEEHPKMIKFFPEYEKVLRINKFREMFPELRQSVIQKKNNQNLEKLKALTTKLSDNDDIINMIYSDYLENQID